MGADEAERDDDELAEMAEDEPGSGAREKRRPSRTLELLLAELRGRSKGLAGVELEREIDRFVDRLVEHHVKAAPMALRDELRVTLRSIVDSHPLVAPLVQQLRTAPVKR